MAEPLHGERMGRPWWHAAGLIAGLLAAFAGVAALVFLGFWSLVFSVPPPPGVVSDASEQMRSSVLGVDGVSAAEISVTVRDRKDGGPLDEPGAWVIDVDVTVQGDRADLARIVAEIDLARSEAQAVAPTTGTITVPAGPDGPRAIISFDEESTLVGPAYSDLAGALALREIPATEAVNVDGWGSAGVVLGSSADLVDATVSAQLVAAGIPNSLGSVTVSNHGDEAGGSRASVTVGPALPPPEATLIRLVADLAARPGVQSVSFDAGRDRFEAETPWRPRLVVFLTESGPVDAVIRSLVSAAGSTVGLPRPSFLVSANGSNGEPVTDVQGYLGLPLGTVEPDDAVNPDPPPGPPPVDPALEEARAQAGSALVESILTEAAAVSGVAVTIESELIACADGRGRQSVGHVLLPVAEQSMPQQQSYDAIVADWSSRGFRSAGGAAGAVLYSAQGLEQVSIRGGVDGISIWVTAECSVTGTR